jgi:CDP-paratose synthetase
VALLLRPGSTLPSYFSSFDQMEIGRCISEKEIFEFIKRSQPNVVIHAACCYGRLNEAYQEVINANIGLGVSILHSLNRIKKSVSFINIATSLPPDVSFYALTKNEFINFSKWFYENSDGNLQIINLLVEHFYGPGDNGSKLIPNLLNNCLMNTETIDLTEGNQKRDFIYIDDLVVACNLIIEKLSQIGRFELIPIGSGEVVSVKEIALLIHRLASSKSILRFGALPYRANEVMCSKIDLAYIKKLGWMPKVSIDSGISRVVAHEINVRSSALKSTIYSAGPKK